MLWAYTHVPRGSARDMTEAITARIEEFAPGFRDVVLASTNHSAAALEHHNPNYVGGDIAAGSVDLRQLVARPVLAADPWRAPGGRGMYLCSASTPPGPGVHGVSGWRAAISALRHEYGITREPDLSPRHVWPPGEALPHPARQGSPRYRRTAPRWVLARLAD